MTFQIHKTHTLQGQNAYILSVEAKLGKSLRKYTMDLELSNLRYSWKHYHGMFEVTHFIIDTHILAIDPLSVVEHLHNMLIEICAGHAVANMSSRYWAGPSVTGGGVEWRLSDQLTEHGMSPCCHLTGAGLSTLKGQAPQKLQSCRTPHSEPQHFYIFICFFVSENYQIVWFSMYKCRQSETDVTFFSFWRRRAVLKWWRRRDVQPEPIAAASFMDWPPFTGCWHACYIKETPPTAAPDNLQHWERRKAAPVSVVICITLREGHFLSWSLCGTYSFHILHTFF